MENIHSGVVMENFIAPRLNIIKQGITQKSRTFTLMFTIRPPAPLLPYHDGNDNVDDDVPELLYSNHQELFYGSDDNDMIHVD